MRFIGNKIKIVDRIYQEIEKRNINANSFFDCFAGSATVSNYFKSKNFQIYSSDLLYFSYVLQQAYIVNNKEVLFKKLLSILNVEYKNLISTPLSLIVEYLNNLPLRKGFIFNNYTPLGTTNLEQGRMYFSDENGMRIDTIREQIEIWEKEKLIDKNEFFILLACLIETVPFFANISGVYSAFQKKWDPRAIKPLKLKEIEFNINNKTNYSYNQDSTELLNIKSDIYYLDPPYNQRQYAPNYHILETIAKNDNPQIKGITGMRSYDNQKSKFCNSKNGLLELEKVAKYGQYKYLILSYNSEGIMPKEKVLSLLSKYGNIDLVEFDYLRFKSNNNGESKTKKYIKEQLYILEKK